MHNDHEQEEQENLRRRIATKAGNQGKKVAKKALKKVAKQAAKAAGKAIFLALKSALTALTAILAPYIGIILAVVFGVIIILLAVQLIFSFGEDSDLSDDANEIKQYIISQNEATVNKNDPEQESYMTPHELIYSVLNVYQSTNDEEEIDKLKSKAAAKTVIKQLKPKFEYDKFEEKVESYTIKCVDGECEKSKVKTDKNKIEYLSNVEAWNGTLTTDVTGIWSEWESHTTSMIVAEEDENGVARNIKISNTTYVRKYEMSLSEVFTEDYSVLEAILRDKPFKFEHADILMVESMFNSTGGNMNYSGYNDPYANGFNDDGYYYDGTDIEVIPGGGVPAKFVPIYVAAQKKYGVEWSILAAVHWRETQFSDPMWASKPNSVGARGAMQFLPCTWVGWKKSYGCGIGSGYAYNSGTYTEAQMKDLNLIKQNGGYGVDGDGDGYAEMFNDADSIFSSANYLAANMKKYKDMWKSLKQYNGAGSYATEVMAKAEEFKKAATVTVKGGGSVGVGGAFKLGQPTESLSLVKNLKHYNNPNNQNLFNLQASKHMVKASPSDLAVIERELKKLVGLKYKLGGNTLQSGLDCSGLVIHILQKVMKYPLQFPRMSKDQAKYGPYIPIGYQKPGDLMFFSTKPGEETITHVAIYLGNGRSIHTYKVGIGVKDQNTMFSYGASNSWGNQLRGFTRPIDFGN